MAAKVRQIQGAWWVVTHHHSKRQKKRIGATKAHKREAEQIAKSINAALVSGTHRRDEVAEEELACDQQLREWLVAYAPTLKATTQKLNSGLIENHLAPYFGDRDLRTITERDLLGFIQDRQQYGLSPKVIRNALSVLRRVYNVLDGECRLSRNPASNIDRLVGRVQSASAKETPETQCWSTREVRTLLRIAEEHEPGFFPLLNLLFATGMRRGEALGLQWADVDFDGQKLTVRRSISTQGESTPKSGRSRRVPLPNGLVLQLLDLKAERRRSSLERGWPEVPSWVFCSEAGTSLDPANVTRVWNRVRRRAQAEGVRPLRLHDARHTWVSHAIAAGKNIRWISDQIGHADPAFTLRTYAHLMPEEETDLSFAEFGVEPAENRMAIGARKRPYTAPASGADFLESDNPLIPMARREGFEPPTLRFEA